MSDTYLMERIEELERRVAALESAASESQQTLCESCNEHKCSYFTHYLVYHDPDINGPQLCHEAYHVAEKRCEEVQRELEEWMTTHPDRHPDTTHLWKQAAFWERKVCA